MQTLPRSRLNHQRSIFRASQCAPRVVGAQRTDVRNAAVATLKSQDLEQLRTWGSSKGIAVEKVAVSIDINDSKPILVAGKDIAPGEAVLSVNDSVWLTPDAVSKSSIGKATAGLEPWLQVALLLVHERFVSKSSQWGGYAASLPTSLGSPLFWTDRQLEMLQGTQLLESMRGYRAFFQSKYQQLFGPQGALSSQPALFPPSAFTGDNFLWAAATVRCRAHAPLEDDKFALVPLADAVSHRREANTVWKVKSAGLFGRNQALVVEATRAIRKGEELCMDYAPDKLDSAVLLDYGAMDRRNPRPGYQLDLSLSQDDRLLDDKLGVVENVGVAPSQQFNLTPSSPPSDAMLQFLRLQQLKGGDVFLLEPVFSNDVWSFMGEPVSEDNERALCTTMAEGARAALAGYASSIDEDLALLRSGALEPGSAEEAAVRVRLGEKEALDAAQQWFEDRLGGLKRLAYYQERRLRRLGLIDDEGRTTYDSFFKDGIA